MRGCLWRASFGVGGGWGLAACLWAALTLQRPVRCFVVVLLMRQYPANEHFPEIVSHVHDQPELVAPDIEYGLGVAKKLAVGKSASTSLNFV